MSKNNIQCPSCGGPNDNSDNKDNISCLYCDQEIITQEVNEGTSSIKPKNEKLYNFLQLADSAIEASNNKEALKYYNKVLEEDASYSAAWFGKGNAVLWGSSLKDIKMHESISSFKNAIKFGKKKNEMKKLIAEELLVFCPRLQNQATNLYLKYKENDPANYYSSYLLRTKIIEIGLAFALECQPESEAIADAGLKFVDKYHKNAYNMMTSGIKGVGDYEDRVSEKYLDLKQRINPEFTGNWRGFSGTSKFNYDRDIGCFIATATMGDYNHPAVISLRGFRDNYLLHQDWGRAFIQFYYKWGPYPANVINKSRVLKKLSYYILVRPLSILVSRITKYDMKNIRCNYYCYRKWK